ncbi:DEKNAAC101156 [Brettanomyces naardenensis]|uniref:DEKNAAC101156 n=1 Tax=Brettanomyces naardenensis TaxID=13370 RepID=A0A448YHC1_BRENA|nr:DEKNAAC101156 [Brettanomyces naardenensis]
MLMQFIVALFVLRTGAGYDFFNFISTLARDFLGFAKDGVAFLTSTQVSQYGMFFFSVLPAIIFFVAVVHIWYQWGLVQWVVSKGSYFFIWTTRTSGCESAAATAAPFIGQGENAILVARLLPYATSSELHAIMTSGFATIAGSVLASYIALGLNPQAMVSSCIMSIPCSLAMSKLRYPEVELSQTNGRVLKPKDLNKDAKVYTNWLEAFIEGATLGLTVAGMVLTSTMCVVSLVAFINAVLTWFGDFWNIDNLSLTMIFGYILYPVAFFLGTPSKDIMDVARLIATKLTFNEYVGYTDLTTMKPYTEMDERSKFIATYCLCGFANFGSVGVNIGVLKTLAPRKSKQVASLVISALITGACSTIISAGIASMVVNDVGRFSTGK